VTGSVLCTLPTWHVQQLQMRKPGPMLYISTHKTPGKPCRRRRDINDCPKASGELHHVFYPMEVEVGSTLLYGYKIGHSQHFVGELYCCQSIMPHLNAPPVMMAAL